MNIASNQIAHRKQVGTLKGRPVFELVTKGGLYVLASTDEDDKIENLGMGPHRAVARFIAEKHHSDLKLTELAKGDAVEPALFMHLVPRWEMLSATVSQMMREG